MMGGARCEGPADRADDTQELIVPTNYPLVGASIGQRPRHNDQIFGTATLAGFVNIDGVVYGLTNHHAIFGSDRMDAYDPLTEPNAVVDQPSEGDLMRTLLDLNPLINKAEKRVPIESWVADKKEKRDICDRYLSSDARKLGSVIRSSGIRLSRAPGRHRLDWALICMNENERCPDPSLFVNQVCKSCFSHW